MKFMVGQVVHHRLFDYRGVVVEAHPLLRPFFDSFQDGFYSRGLGVS